MKLQDTYTDPPEYSENDNDQSFNLEIKYELDLEPEPEKLKIDDDVKEKFLTDKPEVQPTFPEGGWGWFCVLGRFYVQFLLIGSVSAFGIIYIELIDYFHTSRTETAWVGSLAGGVSLFVGPVSGLLTDKLGCRVTTILGACIAATGVFISWFANGIIFLCFTYGIIAGFGMGLMFIPSATIVFHYFSRRRGLASSLGSTGGGVGAMALPLIYAELIEAFGWRGSMWIISGLILNAAVCGMIFIIPNHNKSGNTKARPKATSSISEFFGVFKNIRFVLFFLGTMFCYFGYGVPIVHMPDLAFQKGVSRYQVAWLLSIMGITGVVLRVPVGWLSDKYPRTRPLILGVGMLLCGVGTTLCPHLHSFTTFVVYSVVQGGSMGIFGGLIGVIVADIVGLGATSRGIGFIILSGGVATIISSPLAGFMYDITESYVASFYFAGVVYLLSGFLIGAIFFTDRCKGKR